MSDPIDAILNDALLLIIVAIVAFVFLWIVSSICFLSWRDDRRKKKYRRPSVRRPRNTVYNKPLQMPQLKPTGPRFNPRYSYYGTGKDKVVFRDTKENKDVSIPVVIKR
tara:strand:+ start:632 stop:958 length:327 start_codon:yes stop_codon:yes gene_type:complete